MSMFGQKKNGSPEGDKPQKTAGSKVIEIPVAQQPLPSASSELPALRTDAGDSFEGNQFKSLKNKLLFPASGKMFRTVAVTSPGIGEGKTFVAANLAMSLARNIDGRRILLVDCDVRLPTVHKIFGLKDGTAGLSEYLAGNIPLKSVLLKTKFENLSIIPGGRIAESPPDLLSSRKMLETLEELQTRYEDRHIFLDLPSPRLMAESEMIAGRIDGLIVVVKYGKTTKKHLDELINIVGRENILGVVFNQFDTTMHSSVYRMYRKFIRRK